MERRPVYPPQHTNAEVIDMQAYRERQQAEALAEQQFGLPSREVAGVNVIAVGDRVDPRTQRLLGTTRGEVREDVAERGVYTDPDSGKTKDLDRMTREIVADAESELSELGIETPVDEEAVRSAAVAVEADENMAGQQSKATEKRDEDVTTDEGEQGLKTRAMLEVVKDEVDKNTELLTVPKATRDKLGHLSVVDVVSMDRQQAEDLKEELLAAQTETIVGESADGEEQRFEHTIESGPFLMNVLNGRTNEAMKDLTEDGREQLAARVEDYQEKYGVKKLSDARLEVRDLQRLERIFLRNNKNVRIAQAYQDAFDNPDTSRAA